uniref:Uncharacterized protein n=1 Tax=Aegilops tauschii subsp. strangulata TaxID=200361 RepID=A0A453QN14_AEGTS
MFSCVGAPWVQQLSVKYYIFDHHVTHYLQLSIKEIAFWNLAVGRELPVRSIYRCFEFFIYLQRIFPPVSSFHHFD